MLQVTALLRPGGMGLTAGRAELPLTQTALSVTFSYSGRCGPGGHLQQSLGTKRFYWGGYRGASMLCMLGQWD